MLYIRKMDCPVGYYADEFQDCFPCGPICKDGNPVWKLRHCEKDCPDEYAQLQLEIQRIIDLITVPATDQYTDGLTSTEPPHPTQTIAHGHLTMVTYLVLSLVFLMAIVFLALLIRVLWRKRDFKRKDIIPPTSQHHVQHELQPLNANLSRVDTTPDNEHTTVVPTVPANNTTSTHSLDSNVNSPPTGLSNTSDRDSVSLDIDSRDDISNASSTLGVSTFHDEPTTSELTSSLTSYDSRPVQQRRTAEEPQFVARRYESLTSLQRTSGYDSFNRLSDNYERHVHDSMKIPVQPGTYSGASPLESLKVATVFDVRKYQCSDA